MADGGDASCGDSRDGGIPMPIIIRGRERDTTAAADRRWGKAAVVCIAAAFVPVQKHRRLLRSSATGALFRLLGRKHEELLLLLLLLLKMRGSVFGVARIVEVHAAGA